MDALRPTTVLVSVMLSNNETGVIQPVRKVVEAVRVWEKGTGRKQKVFVHTDAAQVGSYNNEYCITSTLGPPPL